MTDDALLAVLRQIRDELREMNGKDAEGNRYSVNWKVVDHQDERPYPYPLQSEDG